MSHVPRRGTDLEAASQVASGKVPMRIGIKAGSAGNLPVSTSANFHRQEAYRNIPGGTEMLNDWTKKFAGDPLGFGLHGIRRVILRDMAGELHASGTPITHPLVKQLGDKASGVARKLAGLSPDYSIHGIGLYSPNLAQDVGRAAEQHARTVATAKAVYGFIGDHARPAEYASPRTRCPSPRSSRRSDSRRGRPTRRRASRSKVDSSRPIRHWPGRGPGR